MSIEILAYEDTPLGLLCLRRRDVLSEPGEKVTEVTLNHEFLMSSRLTDSERALTTGGLSRLSDSSVNRSVLVGGLGLGYTAVEAIRDDSVSTVEVVEFLPQVIGWLADGLIPLADELNQSSGLAITPGDIYQRLAMPPSQRFDLIIIDVDHSPQDVLGDQSHGFYTAEGLSRAQAHLKPGGVLGVWSYAEDTPLLTQMKSVFTSVEVKQVVAWNDLIDVEQTDWLFFGRKQGLDGESFSDC